MKKKLRILSLIMLIIATIFVYCALSNPALGSVFYIGNMKITASICRIFYGIYIIIVFALFCFSFFYKEK